MKAIMSVFVFGTAVLLWSMACGESATQESTDLMDSPPLSMAKVDWSVAGSVVSVEEAREYTSDFSEEFKGLRGAAVSKELLLEMLKNPKVHGVRVFLGSHKSGDNKGFGCLVFVGLDENGHNILDGSVEVLERSVPCPPLCQ